VRRFADLGPALVLEKGKKRATPISAVKRVRRPGIELARAEVPDCPANVDREASMYGMGIGRLLLMAALHFPIMYLVMFTMIDGTAHFYNNLNMAYMAVMMTAPMLLLEVLLMSRMYQNKRALGVLAAGSVVAFVVFFVFMRQQTAIGDVQFLRSMIPHHSGAILMCGEAGLSDPEIKKLCDQIVASQREEISQMEQILRRLRP